MLLVFIEGLLLFIKPTFSEFYSSVFNDNSASIKVLEKFNSEEFNSKIISYLAYYYKKQNKIEDAVQLYIDVLKNIQNNNNFYYSLISILHETSRLAPTSL